MTEPRNRIPRAAGLTLVELVVAMAITAVIAVMSTQVYVSFLRDDAKRRKIADVQGRARVAFEGIERDLRHAALGAGSGRIWTHSGGNRVARPAVQLFDDVTGGGSIDVPGRWALIGNPKPRSDALLVVEATRGPAAATVGQLDGSTPGMPRTFKVTSLTRTVAGVAETFAAGDLVLVGDYLEATWANVDSVDPSVTPPTVTVTEDFALPGNQVQSLAPGAVVRRARARLYYLDSQDQLVRLELTMPRAPASIDEILGADIIATGVENLQVSCEVEGANGTLSACGGPLASSHEIATESAAFFGGFGATGGPVLDDASTLRTVAFNVAARSPRPLVAAEGDPQILLEGVQLAPGEGGVADGAYVRRAYQVVTGIRNTSLGAF